MKTLIILSLAWLVACRPPANNHQEQAEQSQDPVPFIPNNDIGLVVDYDTAVWAEIIVRPGIILDIKYASTNNFTGQALYPCGRCLVRPPLYQRIQRLADTLVQMNLNLVMLDCYRPEEVQAQLWQAYPDPTYVTPPDRASMHTRGLAIDVTLARRDGQWLDMGSGYDEFSRKSRPGYRDLPEEVLENRQLLSDLLGLVGLEPIASEWWHFSYRQTTHYQADNYRWPCH